MQFRHKKSETLQKEPKRFLGIFLLLISVIGILAGAYLMVLVMTPNIPAFFPVEQIEAKSLPRPQEDRIYIPKIGVNVLLATGGAEALDKGSWHRFPERGDPVQGGNFIVSAHRFSLGLTPGQTRIKSPFYHIDKLAVGDQVIVDFKGKRYGYEVISHNEVKPTQTEIEAPVKSGDSAKMTLYTCTLGGESDGREVYIAKPLGEVDANGNVEKAS